jgi:hypothetical protein
MNRYDIYTLNNLYTQLIVEGGAAGHMMHPFDLPEANTGNQLINIFNKIWDHIQKNPPALKIDGLNVSFRIAGDQFAIDRGSMKPIDVEGITIDRILEKWPNPEHTMIRAATIVLSALNNAMRDCLPELEQLGLLKDPSKFVNAEYVEGTTNVMNYANNFIALHGINKFEQTTPRKRTSREINYSKRALDKFALKLQPYAQEYGFNVVTTIPVETTEAPNFVAVLSQPFSVTYEPGNQTTEPLSVWLQNAKNPRDYKYETANNLLIGACSQQTYLHVLNQIPLNQFVKNEKDFQSVISGAVFYHTTRVLGTELLSKLTSEMGNVSDHEGIVVRGLFSNPVKVTGEFIVNRSNSKFGK